MRREPCLLPVRRATKSSRVSLPPGTLKLPLCTGSAGSSLWYPTWLGEHSKPGKSRHSSLLDFSPFNFSPRPHWFEVSGPFPSGFPSAHVEGLCIKSSTYTWNIITPHTGPAARDGREQLKHFSAARCPNPTDRACCTPPCRSLTPSIASPKPHIQGWRWCCQLKKGPGAQHSKSTEFLSAGAFSLQNPSWIDQCHIQWRNKAAALQEWIMGMTRCHLALSPWRPIHPCAATAGWNQECGKSQSILGWRLFCC